MLKSSAIGVYDSGLGGLSVWREVHRLMPCESLIYLGDGANCPYGNRPKEEISRLADQAVGHLVDMGCKLVVVACNTATAAAIDMLREKYTHIPIVGMEPAVKPACLNTKSRVVAVLATERSLDGELFKHTAKRYGEDIEVLAIPGRGFVEIVENNQEHSSEALEYVGSIVEPLIEKGADQIVLGCTHYPFLKGLISQIIAGRRVDIVDPSPAVARRVKQLLEQQDMLSECNSTPRLDFVTFADEEYRQKIVKKAELICSEHFIL